MSEDAYGGADYDYVMKFGPFKAALEHYRSKRDEFPKQYRFHCEIVLREAELMDPQVLIAIRSFWETGLFKVVKVEEVFPSDADRV